MFKKLPVVVAVSALLLTACGQNSNTATSATPAVASYPMTIQNNGASITLAAKPKSIISLSPSATEMLFAINAGSQVIAVDDQSNFPAEAPISSLSGFTPNLEAIVAKSPDLVVVSNDIGNIVASLTAAKIPVLVEPAAVTLTDTYSQIMELGKATGHSPEAGKLADSMKTEIASAISSLPKTKTAMLLTYYHELDNTLYSVTSTTFIGSIYKLAGLTNIADSAADASGGYPQLSPEFIISADPDLIFLADIKCCSQNLAALAARPGFAGLSAVKNGNVVELNDDIASRWGPRTVDLVKAIVAGVNKATVK